MYYLLVLVIRINNIVFLNARNIKTERFNKLLNYKNLKSFKVFKVFNSNTIYKLNLLLNIKIYLVFYF